MSASVPLTAIAEMLHKHRHMIQTAAQGREWKQSPRVPDSPFAKLKPRKFLKPEFWPISRKFVPAKITNHTVIECFSYTNTLRFQHVQMSEFPLYFSFQFLGERKWEGNCLQLLHHLTYQPQYFLCNVKLVYPFTMSSPNVSYPIQLIRLKTFYTLTYTYIAMYYVECVTLFPLTTLYDFPVLQSALINLNIWPQTQGGNGC